MAGYAVTFTFTLLLFHTQHICFPLRINNVNNSQRFQIVVKSRRNIQIPPASCCAPSAEFRIRRLEFCLW